MKHLLLFFWVQPLLAAVVFNGSTQNIKTPTDSEGVCITPPLALTLSLWIFQNATNYGPIVSKSRTTFDYASYDLTVDGGRTNALVFSYNASPSTALQEFSTTPNLIPVKKWTHVGLSYYYTSATSLKIWVDGVLASGSWTTGTGGVAAVSVGAFPLTVGSNSKTSAKFFDGTIADFAFWYNDNLPDGKMKILGKSRIKRMSEQFNSPRTSNSQTNLAIFWLLNEAPAFSTVSATNFFQSGLFGNPNQCSFYPIRGTPVNSPSILAETVSSYYPNE